MANSLRASLPKHSKQSPSDKGLRARAPYYAAIGVLAILVLAYIDGGEEPIRPISQTVEIPGMATESE
ncbi:hypothetical protein [Erythrobacter sp. THAF29]|uniref:hypothetical protein n=1 Tax=Erythrobacter sp. THAF29 TaxID=2587851 RepID=UPI0012678E26|nr:hypothetical protein [Erythrobacter sp. THAF29]QFT77653.1 hypothetical protein FIU90_08895 [Erythrobacter sp. THAF29]